MTEENTRFDLAPEADVSAPVSADDALKTEFAPLIPGTEIIGRRARRMMMEAAEDQIPLWDDSTLVQSSVPENEDAEPPTAENSSFAEDPFAVKESSDLLPAEIPDLPEETPSVPGNQADSAEDLNITGPAAYDFAAEDTYTPADQIPRRRRQSAPEPAPVKKAGSAVSPFVEFVEIVVGALVAAILVLTLICRTGVVEGASMVPTMHGGDRYVISDLFYTPEQGDIVVFRPGIDGEDELWIKRVIALEGQTVYINPDTYQVYVDGKLLDEPYLGGAGTIPHTTENPITVPEGCVYVLGDNRAISHDSRYEDLGCVEIGQLAGRVVLRFWPLDSFGFCE